MALLNPPPTVIGFGTLKQRMFGLQSKEEKWAIINKRRAEGWVVKSFKSFSLGCERDNIHLPKKKSRVYFI